MSAPKLVMQPQASKVGWLGSQLPLDGTGDFTVTRASTATRINASGLLETVPANVPIIDHSNGCPELVVEPQVTQLLGMTQQFDNAYWLKTSVTVTGGFSSPHVQYPTSAFYLKESSLIEAHYIVVSGLQSSVSASKTYTFSCIAKKGSRIDFGLQIYSETQDLAGKVWFNLQSGTIGLPIGSGVTGTIELLSNDYYKCSITMSTNASSTSINVYMMLGSAYDTNYYQGDGTSGIYIAFAQLQTGSVATSYIPNATTGTVTKVADVITGQTNANNFNSAEGTLFVEMSALANEPRERLISIKNASAVDILRIGFTITNDIRTYGFKDGSQNFNMVYSTNILNYNKIVVRYSQNNFSLWVNGFKRTELLSANTWDIGDFTTMQFDQFNGDNKMEAKIKQLKYYPIALTDAQIQAL